ncbi:hypothetical protein H072_7926 [Dactylellina haptotyla CBS 200.50]|uniref:F-box domain-containing protein n=1 Tax=Dactylellina haptotyla (strain CBS 200.50) TaxID=1284197 RepID=S8A6A3_DACHA|nr:hypothetical protein H072_7926 [Dactylellina haptotyla CBS 200.50]
MDIEASSKVTVVPFLSKHIPEQYTANQPTRKTNSKYCYRHHPDLKCRRQADEPTMEEVQKDLEKLPVSDQQAISHVWTIFSAAPANQRTLMLQGILTQCCFPQLSFISGALRDLIRIDFISALPPELSFRILSFLDTTSLCKAAQVSRRWRTLADDDVVWHKMCEQHIDRKCTKCGWGLPLLERKRLRQTKRQMELRAKGQGLPNRHELAISSDDSMDRKRSSDQEEEDPETSRRAKKVCRRASGSIFEDEIGALDLKERRQRLWKDVYSERYKVESNWRRGRYQSKIFRGHENGIVCIQFDDAIVATGSYDRTIKIWDLETTAEIRTLRGHTNCVRALQFDETKLISGSMDNTLKVWNWRNGTCINTLRGHQAGVVSLHFEGELLASGSVDTTVRLWNFNTKKTTIFRGHTDWVNAVKIHTASNTLFSASDDTTVKLWDLGTRTCIRTFTGHVGHIQQCLPLNLESLDDDDSMDDASVSSTPDMSDDFLEAPVSKAVPKHLLTAALDTTVKLWDVATGRCIKTLFGHTQGIWSLGADSLRAITGAEDGMLKIWDTRTGKCERTVTQHVGPVTCVALSDSRMMSGGQDGEAILYCFKPKS